MSVLAVAAVATGPGTVPAGGGAGGGAEGRVSERPHTISFSSFTYLFNDALMLQPAGGVSDQ